MSAVDLLNLVIAALLLAGVYAAMSVGMTIVYGVMKIVNLAHAGFLMLGAYFGVSLRVSRGQVVSIIGPNGAGKTTTLKALAGLIPVRKGRIIFDGQDVTSEP